MDLYCSGIRVGALEAYAYATPRAEALLRPVEHVLFDQLWRASYFLNVILEEPRGALTEEEENAEYDRRLADLGIGEEALDRFHGGRWEVRSEHPPLQAPITLYECHPDSWLRWRWGSKVNLP